MDRERELLLLGEAFKKPDQVDQLCTIGRVQIPGHEFNFTTWMPGSLDGLAGVAVFLDRLGGRLQTDAWAESSRDCLEFAAKSQRRGAVGLHTGSSGLLWALSVMGISGEYYRLRSACLLLVERFAALELRESEETAGGTSLWHKSHTDMISGMSGVILALLADYGTTGDPHVASLTIQLAGKLTRYVLGENSHGPSLMFAGSFFDIGEPIGAAGHQDWSLSHGLAGVLHALSSVLVVGLKVTGLREAIDLLTIDIIEAAGGSHGFTWPTHIDFERRGGEPTELSGARTTWCYGGLGISNALARASQALGDAEVGEFAKSALLQFSSAPLSSLHLSGLNLCHGVAGLLAALSLRGDLLGDNSTRYGLVETIWSGFDEGETFLFPSQYGEHDVPEAGLLSGAAGIGLTLLLADDPTPHDDPFKLVFG